MNKAQLEKLNPYLFKVLCVACLFPFMNAAAALIAGIAYAMTLGNPYLNHTQKSIKPLLSISIIGLGAGINLAVVTQTGLEGLGYTALTILCTLCIGFFLWLLFRIEKTLSWLIIIGTAICGGSAIAALAAAIQAKNEHISVALVIVFVLNAVALILFPVIGHALDLTQEQFGLWSAIAIHDTSSVVGAGLSYGDVALETGTTVKLARTLWIVPVVLLIQGVNSYQTSKDGPVDGKKAIKIPWFIFGFIAVSALVTYIPNLQPAGDAVSTIARQLLVLTLFLIGSTVTRQSITTIGSRPLIFGTTLWIIISVLSLAAIYWGMIA